MVHISTYFSKFGLTNAASQNFVILIKEGLEINGVLSMVDQIDDSLKMRIKNYFISCYEVVYAAALEVPDEYCEALEILDDFRDQALLLNEFLNGNLDDLMFI